MITLPWKILCFKSSKITEYGTATNDDKII